MPPLTPAEFEVLAARTGIPFSDAQKAILRGALPTIDAFTERTSKAFPRAAEPALTLSVEPRP